MNTEGNTTMTAISNDIDSFFHGSSQPSMTKDMTIGEVREGIVIQPPEMVQATKFQSRELDFFANGDPKMQLRIQMSTSYQLDADDAGDRTLYVKTWGGMSRAFEDAVRAAGHAKVSEAITPGTVVTITYLGKQTVRTKNGSTFEENAYEFGIVPAAAPGAATSPAPAAVQPPAPAQQGQAAPPAAPPATPPAAAAAPAPAAPAAAPGNPADMIAAGWTDEQITQAVPGLTPDVIGWLRSQAA